MSWKKILVIGKMQHWKNGHLYSEEINRCSVLLYIVGSGLLIEVRCSLQF